MHRSTGPVTTETEDDFSFLFFSFLFFFCKPGKQEIQANLGIFLGTPMSLVGGERQEDMAADGLESVNLWKEAGENLLVPSSCCLG